MGGTAPVGSIHDESGKAGGYAPRREREQRAYWLAVGGGGAGVIGAVGIVLAVAGVIGSELLVITLIVAGLCTWGFMRTVASR